MTIPEDPKTRTISERKDYASYTVCNADDGMTDIDRSQAEERDTEDGLGYSTSTEEYEPGDQSLTDDESNHSSDLEDNSKSSVTDAVHRGTRFDSDYEGKFSVTSNSRIY